MKTATFLKKVAETCTWAGRCASNLIQYKIVIPYQLLMKKQTVFRHFY